MDKVRRVRLLFILAAICVFAVFWIGFRFGKVTQEKADMLYYSQKELEATSKPTDTGAVSSDKGAQGEDSGESFSEGKTTDDTLSSENTHEGEDTVESGNVYETPKFYLKQSGDYLTVYVSATDEVYFETDIPVADLPAELQDEVKEGIDFYDLEDLYNFLESYSS